MGGKTMISKRQKQVEDCLLQQYDKFYRLAYGYVQNEQDALDIVQESAYRAVKDCDNLKNELYLSTWLYRIVINTALEFLRKQKWEITVEDNTLEMIAGVCEDVVSLHIEWELQEILEQLSPKDKTVVMLRYFEDCKLEDIAQITRENVNTVKARLYRTLRKMRKKLE